MSFPLLRLRFGATLVVLALATTPILAQATLGPGETYSENFDSMGVAGTTPPTGWSVLNLPGNNGTFTTDMPAASVSGGTVVSPLTATNNPTANNNNGYNAATATDNTANRVLTTAPTTIAAAVLQLSLTNNTGAALTSLLISYDIRRFTSVGTDNELPGYRLFFSLNGGTDFTNVAALNPVLTGSAPSVVVPNTVGVTNVALTTIALGGSVANGQQIIFRFVDDNAVQTSPDQIIGLDNVVISRVTGAVTGPEPATALLAGLGLVAVGFRARRQIRGQA